MSANGLNLRLVWEEFSAHFDRVLNRRNKLRVGQAAVANDTIGGRGMRPAGATMRLHRLPNKVPLPNPVKCGRHGENDS